MLFRSRNLRRKAEERDRYATENETLNRRLALAEAGLALSDKQKDALLKVHDGEWTKDALLATATDLGFAQAKQEEQPDTSTHQRISEDMAGSPPPADRQAVAREIVASSHPRKEQEFWDRARAAGLAD